MAAYVETLQNVLHNLPEYLAEFTPRKKTVAVASTPLPVQTADMSWIIRVAGLSGAVSISLGAYGAHVIRDDPEMDPRRVVAFETGSRYHLIHSLALLASTKARYPALTAALFGGGILLFCGPCYHYSITGKEDYRKITPKGGVLFILAWLSLIL